MSFKSFNGHYMMSRDSVTGQKDCHSCNVMVIIWCHAFQYWSLSLSLRSIFGHYMSCYSVTCHKDCHSCHSRVIIWCHAIQYLVIKFVIEVIHWSLYDVTRLSNWSLSLSLRSFIGHYMSCDSVTCHKGCHSSHSMVTMRCHALQWLVISFVIHVIQWSLSDVTRFSIWSLRLSFKSIIGQ